MSPHVVSSVPILRKALDLTIIDNYGKPYSGAGEYLVWSQIDKEGIIGGFTMSGLTDFLDEDGNEDVAKALQLPLMQGNMTSPSKEKMKKKAPAFGRNTGVALGKLVAFAGVKQEYLKLVGHSFAESLKFRGCNRQTMSPLHKGFVAGLVEGYQQITSGNEPTSSIPIINLDDYPDFETDADDGSDEGESNMREVKIEEREDSMRIPTLRSDAADETNEQRQWEPSSANPIVKTFNPRDILTTDPVRRKLFGVGRPPTPTAGPQIMDLPILERVLAFQKSDKRKKKGNMEADNPFA